jgi:hypothetical protein
MYVCREVKYALRRQRKATSHAVGACICSDVKEDGRLVGELHLLNTEDGSVHLVVDEGQVSDGGSLTDSAELVVHGSVTQADPSLVGSEVGHGNATEMGANGRAAKNGRVTGLRDGGLGLLIELGGFGKGVGLVDLGLGETSHEDKLSVPGGLEHFTGRKLRDVELLVGVSHVSASSDHLGVNDGDEGLNSEAVVSENETLDHVELSTTDFVVTVFLIPDSRRKEHLIS